MVSPCYVSVVRGEKTRKGVNVKIATDQFWGTAKRQVQNRHIAQLRLTLRFSEWSMYGSPWTDKYGGFSEWEKPNYSYKI